MEKKSFGEYYGSLSPVPYYVMLTLFSISNMLLVVNFTMEAATYVAYARLIINSAVILLGTMYFAFTLLMWKRTPLTYMLSIGSIAILFLVWNHIGATYELFSTSAAAVLALLAYKKDYRVVLKIFFVSHITTIIVGALGLYIGYAEPAFKRNTDWLGISLGLIYPNHLGRLVFIAMAIAWYLWGQKRRVLTTIAFSIASYIMWAYVKCRTITFFMLGLVVCWWIWALLSKIKVHRIVKYILHAIATLMPFICFGITYGLGQMRYFLDSLSHYGTATYSLFMRFISAGSLFDYYGFPLTGHDVYIQQAPIEYINGHEYVSDVVDNAFIFYLIALGLIALVLCMAWLSFSIHRALKNEDYALVLLGIFMCGYGLIETVLFQFEHNFMWFYPLTATAMLYKITKQKTPEIRDAELNPNLHNDISKSEDSSKPQGIYLASNGYEYLENYLTKVYGERGSFEHNLNCYAESDEFRLQSHVINSLNDIKEITINDLKSQVQREEYFQTLALDTVKKYDELKEKDKSAIYDIAGIMGLAPGFCPRENTLFPHLLDLYVSSEQEGLDIEKSCEQNPDTLRVMVSTMVDGIRDHQLISSQELNIYSQGYARNLWRGENAYNNHCYASMYRGRPSAPQEAELQDFIGTLRMVEFSLWLNGLSFVKNWPYGNVLHGAIAQHYGIPTNGIDLTSDIKTALFFACTKYENGMFRPLKPCEYEKADSRPQVASRGGDSRYGVLFQAPVDVINMSYMIKNPELHFTSARPIGYQPFMRCGNQKGYIIETGPGFDLYREPCFAVYKFRLTPEICDWAYGLVDGNANIYPDEAFGTIDDIVEIAKGLKRFSEKAFYTTLNHLALQDRESYFREALMKNGIQIENEIELGSKDRINELESQFWNNSADYKKRLESASFRLGFSIGPRLAKEALTVETETPPVGTQNANTD